MSEVDTLYYVEQPARFNLQILCSKNATGGGGFLVQRSIRGRAAEMGLKISLLV